MMETTTDICVFGDVCWWACVTAKKLLEFGLRLSGERERLEVRFRVSLWLLLLFAHQITVQCNNQKNKNRHGN